MKYAIIAQQMLCYCSNQSLQAILKSNETCNALCIDSFERCGRKKGIDVSLYQLDSFATFSNITNYNKINESNVNIIDINKIENYDGYQFDGLIILPKTNKYTISLS